MEDAVTLESSHLNRWGLVDQNGNLRMRAFLPLCISPLFNRLEDSQIISSLRAQGIARVLYYADFSQSQIAVPEQARLRVYHSLKLYRSRADRTGKPSQTGRERILWHSVCRVENEAESSTTVGISKTLHVLTRPAAAPNERMVTLVPETLSHLRVYDWLEDFPVAASILSEPALTCRSRGVWGTANTDIKGHVNALEYIMGFENQTACQLDHEGKDAGDYEITRAEILFRRPFMAGQRYILASQIPHTGSSIIETSFTPEDGNTASHSSPQPSILGRMTVAPVAHPFN